MRISQNSHVKILVREILIEISDIIIFRQKSVLLLQGWLRYNVSRL